VAPQSLLENLFKKLGHGILQRTSTDQPTFSNLSKPSKQKAGNTKDN